MNDQVNFLLKIIIVNMNHPKERLGEIPQDDAHPAPVHGKLMSIQVGSESLSRLGD